MTAALLSGWRRECWVDPNQDVTFLTDGGEEVRSLTELITLEAEHVLDWFHITMRLTVLSQHARGVMHHDKAEGARLLASLDSIKWLLWHGNSIGPVRKSRSSRTTWTIWK